jgi:pantoate--beta-alanine ligase
METATRLSDLRTIIREYKQASQTVGFVPTMGALHEGHLSLVRMARKHVQKTVVSIFVNPTQFGPNEDFRVYPRTPERDQDLLAREHVDVLFMPEVAEVYPESWAMTVDPGPVGETFEGAVRPGHFKGVLTVVAKLLNMVSPDAAVFGQKDAQQLFLIRRMVADLNIPVQILEGDTLREPDGLALSSRNAYLDGEQRKKAIVLYRALSEGKKAIENGERSLGGIKAAMRGVFAKEPDYLPDYATAVNETNFVEADPIPEQARLIIAGRLGPVRLIDNLRLF